MGGYIQQDKGVFEVWLIRENDGLPIAFTDYDIIKTTKHFTDEDKEALEEFKDEYDMEEVR